MYGVISAWYQGVVTGDKTAVLAGVVVGWGRGLCSKAQEVVWGPCLEAFLRKTKRITKSCWKAEDNWHLLCSSSLVL